MGRVVVIVLLIVRGMVSYSQTLTGEFFFHAEQQIELYGHTGLKARLLDSCKADSLGRFELNYSVLNKGMGYLQASDYSTIPIVLDGNNIKLSGTHLVEYESFRFVNSIENKSYYDYINAHQQHEAVLSGWKYTLKQYQANKVYQERQQIISIIQTQIKEVEAADVFMINSLPDSSYVKYLLPIQNLVESIATVAKYYPEEIPSKLAQFRSINYADKRLYYSGMLSKLLDAHYWLIENSGKPLDSVFVEMNLSTDLLLESLENDNKVFNEVTDYLFDLLEKHSLFKASEYLALKVLTQNSCTVDADLANQLEIYRTMKVGNKAKDLLFNGVTVKEGKELQKRSQFTHLSSAYKLIIFGASWCPKCTQEIPKVSSLYHKWQGKGMDVVLVSLDNNKEDYISFVKDFPFLSTCDFKQWDTQAAKDYHVFSTPTMFLLDRENNIVLRPNSIEQVDAWIEFYL
ncbi:MAG: thioredoxin-like domain-containing protein [Flavobacteriales bacterium]|jgi:thiol-disulfide isomerase/thioredoxin|nr:thioredoxin-like domain-containing protein [Flavobacteriales bacterium]